MHMPSHAETYGHEPAGHRATRMLWLIFIGTAFVLNSYLASWIYSDNPLVSDVSAAVGALLLAAPILVTAVRDLMRGAVHMNELVTLAVLAAFVFGDFQTAGVIAFFMLLSLVIETRTAEGAHASIESLVRLTPTTARRLTEGGAEEQVGASDLREGDRIRLRPGDNVPADGVIEEGRSTLNEATITGESLPRDKGPEEQVFAGTHNLTGQVVVRVTRAGEDTTLGRVRDLIMAAERTKLPFMRLVDRYAGYYTPTVLMIAALVWFFTGETERVIALLVVSCPCALILATPTAMVAALSAAARLGILIKHVADLEATAHISAFVFDKTGTLTTGRLGVSRMEPAGDVQPSALLLAAAGIEQYSHHPAAVALVELAREAELDLQQPADFHEEAGQGVRALVGGEATVAGRASWLRDNGIDDPQLARDEQSGAAGLSIIFVGRAGRYLGWIGLQDQVRPEARDSLKQLRDLGIHRLAMVTGDRSSVAEQVAAEIACPEFKPNCLPQEKVDFVNRVRDEDERVAVVGDGVNDAPALKAGDIGIAMGAAGSDVAIHSATIALMNNDLRRIPFLIRLSRQARVMVFQNLGVGLCFIVVGVILSGLGYLNPIIAALMHNAGSLIVIFNSARLVRAGQELEQDRIPVTEGSSAAA